MAKFDFGDNIKHYYTPPKALFDETLHISEIMHDFSNTQFIALSGKNSDDLIEKERSLDKSYIKGILGISSVF